MESGWISNVVAAVAIAAAGWIHSEMTAQKALVSSLQAQMMSNEVRDQRVIDLHLDLLQRVSRIEGDKK